MFVFSHFAPITIFYYTVADLDPLSYYLTVEALCTMCYYNITVATNLQATWELIYSLYLQPGIPLLIQHAPLV